MRERLRVVHVVNLIMASIRSVQSQQISKESNSKPHKAVHLTFETSQAFKSELKWVAPLNIFDKVVTCHVCHRLKSGEKSFIPWNNVVKSSTRETSLIATVKNGGTHYCEAIEEHMKTLSQRSSVPITNITVRRFSSIAPLDDGGSKSLAVFY